MSSSNWDIKDEQHLHGHPVANHPAILRITGKKRIFNSEPGKINVSEKTYELAKNQFKFTYCGEVAAKNKVALKMYFVEE